MSAELLIVAANGEVRAARVEDGTVVDLVVERQSRASLIGNIYRGRVRRLAPGLAAAFVDIGLARDGFLPLGPKRPDSAEEAEPTPPLPPVAEGEAICVQLVRDAARTKGPQLSRRLSLAGGRLVLLPGGDRIAVSRLIADEAERDRLAGVLAAIARPGEGFIVRTAAEGAGEDDLARDAAYLRARWQDIAEISASAGPPALLHAEPDAIERVMRDHGLGDVDMVRVGDAESFGKLCAFCRRFAPEFESRLSLHRGPSSLFEAYDIDGTIDQVCRPRVGLPSGGSLVIETTEALTAIDVNSGSLTQTAAQSEAALRTNLEAAAEIARQVRLRNLGGMIVVDFISMDDEAAWTPVLDALARGLARDRVSSRLFGRTAAGLVEITRRRQRISLAEAMTEPCALCTGSGRLATAETVAHAVLARLRREARHGPAGALVVTAPPDVVAALEAICAEGIAGLEKALGRRIVLDPVPGTARDAVDLHVA